MSKQDKYSLGQKIKKINKDITKMEIKVMLAKFDDKGRYVHRKRVYETYLGASKDERNECLDKLYEMMKNE